MSEPTLKSMSTNNGWTAGRGNGLMFPQPDAEFSQFLFTQDRQNLSMISQFLSGHNYLKYHLWNMARAPNDRCQ